MNNQNYEHIVHPFKPVHDKNSIILILGSFPSIKSRENSFYYSNPRNRFWEILAELFNEDVPKTIPDMVNFLYRNNIAIYDVVLSCDIVKSYDNTIKNIIPTDLKSIINKRNINKVFTNGNKATSLYKKYHEELTGIKAIGLPSSSPANARYSQADLIDKWKVIKDWR